MDSAADLDRRLAAFSPTLIDFDEDHVALEDRKVLIKLVKAADLLDEIYQTQVSSDLHVLRQKLAAEKAPPATLQYFDIMYGPWDRLKGNTPFIGQTPKPLGAGFYPADLTKQEFEEWVQKHPEDQQSFHSYFTMIRRQNDRLVAIPYSEYFRPQLKKAAQLLKEAMSLSQSPVLRKYLRLRAEAFLSNDYFESDLAWMDLGGDSAIEVVMGPYEVYEDHLMGYKAAMEAFIALRDPDYSKRLQKIASYSSELEEDLPVAHKLTTRRGKNSPISVVVELYTAGDARAGVQTAAFNLPNDERVRAQKGSKKVMLKNVMEAKFQKSLIPIAQRLVEESVQKNITFEAYFTEILLHEMAHGEGPGMITVDGRNTEVSRELKELYPAIEECKADIVGLVNSAFLIKKGVLPQTLVEQIPAAYLAGLFRAVRFGSDEAHGKGVLLAFNYLLKKGAITYNSKNGRYAVQYKLFPNAVRDLARELLDAEATGSYEASKQLLDTYGVMNQELQASLAKLKDLPVDIRPHYTILEKMKNW